MKSTKSVTLTPSTVYVRSMVVLLSLMLVGLVPVDAMAATDDPLPIPEAEVNESLPPGLIQYSDIAAELNDIAAASDRVSVEVFGQSAAGRDLYLATVSDPKADKGRTRVLRRMMLRDPARAQQLAARFGEFRVPVFINASIHGNEYEGVDAGLELLRRLAFSDEPEVQHILDNVILLLNVVQNPDGRVDDTRANSAGFNLNRDFITNAQPETQAVRDLLVEWNPMVTLDLHGYVYPMLIEPTTPPHNPNYEYDLYIKSALAQAKAMEDAVLDSYDMLANDPDFAGTWEQYSAGLDDVEKTVIPFRDWEVGDWDDWPPIFTPMYAMYHGSYGHTLEAPLNPRSSQLSPEEKAARARINTEALLAASWATLEYVADNKLEMVTDQIEVFRRGAEGVAPVPVEPGFVPGFGPEDQYVADYPEAYVIPVGENQESLAAAEVLVDFLLAHGVEVGSAVREFTAQGQTWPTGSFVVSMQQPRRGLANTMLELGYDISLLTPQMYDISGWSHAELWGATVVSIPAGTDLRVRTRSVRDAEVDGSLAASAAAFAFDLDSELAIRALNALLDADVDVVRSPSGQVVVPGSARSSLTDWAEDGLVFTSLSAVPGGSESLDAIRIAAAANGDERFVLDELGFDVTPITEDDLISGVASLTDFDVLLVSSGLDYADLGEPAQAALAAWRADGGGVVGISSTGAFLNEDAGWLEVGFERGPACATANGVVAVDNSDGSAVTAGFDATDTSFVFGPVWFTDVGDDVTVDQSYDTDDVLLAGHWLGDFEAWIGDDTAGDANCTRAREGSSQDDAAGQASIVSGTTDGGRVVLFGTEPMFRAHPKKLYGQVANALYWVSAG